MAAPLCTDAELIAAWHASGGDATAVAVMLGFGSQEAVNNRRKKVELRHQMTLRSKATNTPKFTQTRRQNSRRLDISLRNGRILIGSDAHIWPGPLTTAQRAFIALAKKLQPELIVLNGDVFDGAKVSRFPPGIWEQEARPSVQQELEACQDFIEALRKAAPNSKLIWTWGNHDARFEYRLSAVAPEYQGVKGFALGDHFPGIEWCMALVLNDTLIVKHRFKGGRHAPENNTLWDGRSIVTGHLHSQKVQPITDSGGTRYGVDAGTMAEPESKQFDYTEENQTGWRMGFALLTIVDANLLMPELIKVCDWNPEAVEFRGEIIPV